MTALDEQIGGSHYKDFKIQPVEFIHHNGIDFLSGNVIKYVCRYKSKGGLNDLEKAKHYIELLIELSINKYCQNCTDINENIFIKKLDCKCEDKNKSDIHSFKERENEPLTPLNEVLKEITDTERLDFLSDNNFELQFSYDSVRVIDKVANCIGKSSNCRQAIDSAMRSKNGK